MSADIIDLAEYKRERTARLIAEVVEEVKAANAWLAEIGSPDQLILEVLE